MFTKDLSGNVPLYGQEQCTWCGAASGQMIRNGYPTAANRLFYNQVDVWNTIQANNSTNPADSGWATDPVGLTACLQSLSNPAGVHWVTFRDTNRDTVLFDMLYWMNIREYPSAVLINQGGHWVVIVGYTTDVAPVAGSTPTLQSISIHDPEPHNVGTDTLMTGAQWFSGPWNGSIIYTGTWFNQYVAVVEPPIQKGSVRVKQVKRTGEKLLSAAEAVKHAKRWVAELKVAEQAKYSLLRHEDAVTHEPMLVREETAGKRAKSVPHYYIVPFGLRREISDRGTGLARVCVLINAFTGQLEEVSSFGSPIRYVTREDALNLVAAALQTDREKLENADATLVFQAGDITHIRTYPFWRVTLNKRNYYIDQLGKLYGKFLPAVPGD
jgi:hypothetical protein